MIIIENKMIVDHNPVYQIALCKFFFIITTDEWAQNCSQMQEKLFYPETLITNS